MFKMAHISIVKFPFKEITCAKDSQCLESGIEKDYFFLVYAYIDLHTTSFQHLTKQDNYSDFFRSIERHIFPFYPLYDPSPP